MNSGGATVPTPYVLQPGGRTAAAEAHMGWELQRRRDKLYEFFLKALKIYCRIVYDESGKNVY